MVQRTAMELISLLCDDQEQQEYRAVVHRAVRVLQQHAERRLSMSDLALQLKISPEHLARTFRDDIGMSPQAFYRQVRLDRAKELLNTTDLPVKAIAARVHYGKANLAVLLRRMSG